MSDVANRQTNTGKNITSLAEVINLIAINISVTIGTNEIN